jgi:hypothetical protein
MDGKIRRACVRSAGERGNVFRACVRVCFGMWAARSKLLLQHTYCNVCRNVFYGRGSGISQIYGIVEIISTY